jgi:hypothetical protein
MSAAVDSLYGSSDGRRSYVDRATVDETLGASIRVLLALVNLSLERAAVTVKGIRTLRSSGPGPDGYWRVVNTPRHLHATVISDGLRESEQPVEREGTNVRVESPQARRGSQIASVRRGAEYSTWLQSESFERRAT